MSITLLGHYCSLEVGMPEKRRLPTGPAGGGRTGCRDGRGGTTRNRCSDTREQNGESEARAQPDRGDRCVRGHVFDLGLDVPGHSLCRGDDSAVVYRGNPAFGGRLDLAGAVRGEAFAAHLGADSRQLGGGRPVLPHWAWVAALGGVACTFGSGGAADRYRADYCVSALLAGGAALARERYLAGWSFSRAGRRGAAAGAEFAGVHSGDGLGRDGDFGWRDFVGGRDCLFAALEIVRKPVIAFGAVAAGGFGDAARSGNSFWRMARVFRCRDYAEVLVGFGVSHCVRIGDHVYGVQLAAGTFFADAGGYAYVCESDCGRAAGMVVGG